MSEMLNPKSRSDPYGSRINRTHSRILAYAAPWLSIMVGSLVTQLPIAVAVPLMPPLGFLMLISWRLVRPGLLPVWVGVPLGAFDDLFSGQPFGSGILLWSLTMLAIELLEFRFPWRGFVQDWLVASLMVSVYLALAALLSGASPSPYMFVALAPQLVLSLLLFPIVARLTAGLDRLRLTRIRVLG